eukprot:scpid101314/ scgid4446/ 
MYPWVLLCTACIVMCHLPGVLCYSVLSISRNRIDFNPALEKQGLAAFALFGNPFTSQPYHSSPHARRETRESLRHGSTATWRRRHHRPAKNSPAAVSPLLRARNAGITESRVTIF